RRYALPQLRRLGAVVGRFMRSDSKLSVVQSSLLAFLVAAAILSLSGCRTSATGGDDPAPEPGAGATRSEDGAAEQQPAAGAGMQVHIDPETGEFLDEPPPGTELGGDVPTPPSGAVERPAPGGGVMIELQPKSPPATE
ncbi:MAG TPA: hypothetical protein VD788_10710, partial [Candidatus Polarisedimenticolaceae bacterium]|nr:hypothetical protein [Candidatus Polarisedimenticolaceae bacterium]